MRRSTALLSVLLMTTFGLVSMPTTVMAADPEPKPCTEQTGWDEIQVDVLQYTYPVPPATLPLGKVIVAVCAKGPNGSLLFERTFSTGVPSWTFDATSYGDTWKNPNGQFQNISHIGVKLADAPPVDVCPLTGDQGPNDPCQRTDEDFQDVRSYECGDEFAEVQQQKRSRTQTWDGDSWEPSDTTTGWGSWTNVGGPTQVAPTTAELAQCPSTDVCPLPGDQGPNDPCQRTDEDVQDVRSYECGDEKAEVQQQKRTRTQTWDGDSWEPSDANTGWGAWVNDGSPTLVDPTTAELAQCPPEQTDACPGAEMPGNQPGGTDCDGPNADRETRTVTTVDCQSDTVSSQPQFRSRTYTWNGNTWVPGAWSDWANDGAANVTGASDTQCPTPPPTDVCLDIPGDQPDGTDCDNPGPLVEQRSTTTTDCQADTVTTVIEEMITEYEFIDNAWVPVPGDWEIVSSVVRPANNKECAPDTEVEGEEEEVDDKDDKDPNKPNPVEVKGEQASAPPKAAPAVSVPTVVAAGLGEGTPAQPGGSPLALLMVLFGALLSAAAATRRRARA